MTTPPVQPTRVSAYIDGKAHAIEALKLGAVDKFERILEDRSELLSVTVDGQRHSRWSDALRFAAFGLGPTVLSVTAGSVAGGLAGALLGGLAGLSLFLLPATFFLHRGLKAPQWPAG